MRDSNWIRQYHDEQEQIHMPATCRQNILDLAEQEEELGMADTLHLEPVQPTKRYSWRIAIVAFLALILAGLAATLAVSIQHPASNMPEIENVEIFADSERDGTITSEDSMTASTETAIPDDTNADMAVTKKILYYRSLNAEMYLHQFSGNITVQDAATPDLTIKGVFWLDFDTDCYYARMYQMEETDYQGTISHGATTYYVSDSGDGTREMYIVYDSVLEGIHDYEYIQYGDSQSEYNRLTDTEIEATPVEDMPAMPEELTGIDVLAPCIAPTDLAEIYLSDFDSWAFTEVVRSNERQDYFSSAVSPRTVVSITGEHENNTFTLEVDYETGIWLSFTVTDPNGQVQYAFDTYNLNFYEDGDSEIYVRQLSEADKEAILQQYTPRSQSMDVAEDEG